MAPSTPGSMVDDKEADQINESSRHGNHDNSTATGNHGNQELCHCHGNQEAAPNGGFGWAVMMAAFVIYFFNGAAFYCNGVLYPSFLDQFRDVSEVTLAWVPSVQTSLVLLTGVVSGPLVETLGCRRVVFIGTLLCAVGYLVSAFSSQFVIFFIFYSIFTGVGLGFQYIPCLIIIQQYFTTRRSVATGIATSGSGVGTFVYGVVCRLLLDEYGWRGTVLTMSACVLHCIPAAFFFRPLSKSRKECQCVMQRSNKETHLNEEQCLNKEDDYDVISVDGFKGQHVVVMGQSEIDILQNHCDVRSSTKLEAIEDHEKNELQTFINGKTADNSEPCDSKSNWEGTQQGHRDPPLLRPIKKFLWSVFDCSSLAVNGVGIFTAVLCVALAGSTIAWVYVPLLAIRAGHGPLQAAALISIMGLSDMAGRFLSGFLTQIPFIRTAHIMDVATLLSGVGVVAFTMAKTYPVFIFFSVCTGFGVGSYVAMTAPRLVDFVGPALLGRVLGIAYMFVGIFYMLAPPFAAFLAEAFDDLSAAFYFGGVTQITAAVVFTIQHMFFNRTAVTEIPGETIDGPNKDRLTSRSLQSLSF